MAKWWKISILAQNHHHLVTWQWSQGLIRSTQKQRKANTSILRPMMDRMGLSLCLSISKARRIKSASMLTSLMDLQVAFRVNWPIMIKSFTSQPKISQKVANFGHWGLQLKDRQEWQDQALVRLISSKSKLLFINSAHRAHRKLDGRSMAETMHHTLKLILTMENFLSNPPQSTESLGIKTWTIFTKFLYVQPSKMMATILTNLLSLL